MVEPDGHSPDRRAGDRIDIIERQEPIKRRLRGDMDKPVGLQFGVSRQGVSHGRFDIGVPDGKNAQNEVAASLSRDFGSDPVKRVVVVRAQIGLRLAVGQDPETSGRGASGKEQCEDAQGQGCFG